MNFFMVMLFFFGQNWDGYFPSSLTGIFFRGLVNLDSSKYKNLLVVPDNEAGNEDQKVRF